MILVRRGVDGGQGREVALRHRILRHPAVVDATLELSWSDRKLEHAFVSWLLTAQAF